MRPPMKWGERIQSTGAAHGGSGRRSERAASETGPPSAHFGFWPLRRSGAERAVSYDEAHVAPAHGR